MCTHCSLNIVCECTPRAIESISNMPHFTSAIILCTSAAFEQLHFDHKRICEQDQNHKQKTN